MSARVEKLESRKVQRQNSKKNYIFTILSVKIYTTINSKSHILMRSSGPLGHGVGVCEGIAKSVKVLCDALGVWCIIVISRPTPKED